MNHNKIIFTTFLTLKHRLVFVGIIGLYANFSLSQYSILSFGPTVLSLGTTGGIQPNYRQGSGSNFLFGSIDQQVTVKGLPFQFVGRLSNEPYLSGRASYFRLSYQGKAYKRTNLDSLQMNIQRLEAEKLEKLKGIYALEGKLGYLKYLDQEYPKSDSLPLPTLPSIDSLLPGFVFPNAATDLNQPTIGVPQIPSLPDTSNLSELDRLLLLADFAIAHST